MKFMGSKRSMLLNGLGEAIAEMAPSHRRFVDLFTGSGVVAWHVAQKYDVEVLAGDLQQFCVVLASSVISRTKPLDGRWLDDWIAAADVELRASSILVEAKRLQELFAMQTLNEWRSAQGSCAKRRRRRYSMRTGDTILARSRLFLWTLSGPPFQGNARYGQLLLHR